MGALRKERPYHRNNNQAYNKAYQHQTGSAFHIVHKFVATGTEYQSTRRSANGSCECAGCSNSNRYTNRAQQRSRSGVGHELCQEAGDGKQYYRYNKRCRFAAHQSYCPVSNQLACAGFIHCSGHRHHTRKQEDGYPVDGGISLFFSQATRKYAYIICFFLSWVVASISCSISWSASSSAFGSRYLPISSI